MAGIGGRTVAEAKRNLSLREVNDWFVFAKKRGGLLHSERLLAIIAAQINQFAGGEAQPSDFFPALARHSSNEPEATIADVMNILSSTA